MAKYYKKPKGVDAWTAAEGPMPPWMTEAFTAGRLVLNGQQIVVVIGPASIPLGPTDWLVLDEIGALVPMTDAAFQDTYGKDTGAPAPA
jgi:hypothetical protein